MADSELILCKSKGKIFYGQEHHRGESTTTVCGVNYHVLACSNATEVAQWAAASCSRQQPAMDNGVRYRISN